MTQRRPTRSALGPLLSGLLLAACGAGELPGSEWVPSEEPLGTREAAMCSGLSVTSLTLDGISTYQGELAGAGTYAVSTFANAVSLEFSVDGQTPSSTERLGSSGTWSYSRTGVACGSRTFEVKAYPMVVASDGTKTVCRESYKSVTRIVTEPCPTIASISCSRISTEKVRCTGQGSGGSGAYTPSWKTSVYSYYDQMEYSWPSYLGLWTVDLSCRAVPANATAHDVLRLDLKVTDSNGVTSNTVSSPNFKCAPMYY
jgi:hypothetical protein